MGFVMELDWLCWPPSVARSHAVVVVRVPCRRSWRWFVSCVVTSTSTSAQLRTRLATAQGRFDLASALADADAEGIASFTVEAGSLSLVDFVPQQSEDQAARPDVAVDIYFCQAGSCATAGSDDVRLLWNAALEVAVRASAQAGVSTASFSNVHLLWTAAPLSSGNGGGAVTTDGAAASVAADATTEAVVTNNNRGTTVADSSSNASASAETTTQSLYIYNPYFRERRSLVDLVDLDSSLPSAAESAQTVWGALGVDSRKAIMPLPSAFVDAAVQYELSAVGSVEINGVVHDVSVQHPLRFSFNAPPQLLSVSAAPSKGTVLLTTFGINVAALEVDAQDLPLSYT